MDYTSDGAARRHDGSSFVPRKSIGPEHFEKIEQLASSSEKKWHLSALTVGAKAAITAVLLYLVFSSVDLARLPDAIAGVRPETFVFTVLLHVAAYLLGALRWWLLARQAGVPLSFTAVIPSYYLGIFSNNFLPTGVGGDLVRILHLQRMNVGMRPLIAATISDRLIGLAAVLATALAATSLGGDLNLGQSTRATILGTAIVAAASIWVFATDGFGAFADRLARRFQHTRIRRTILETVQSLHRLRDHKALVGLALGLSVVVQSLITISYYLLARDIGLDQPPWLFFAVIPVVFLVAALPISLGGLGVREGTFVMLMTAAGADRHLAVSVSVAYLAAFWSSTLPGVLGLLVSRQDRTMK
jgi:glycosyltransferase 2 family protein